MINIDYFVKWQELDLEVEKNKISENVTKYLAISSYNDVFITNNSLMSRSFSVEFDPETTINYEPKTVNGIKIELKKNKQLNENKVYLVLSNVDSKNDDAFIGFSAHIFDSLIGAKSEIETLNNIEQALEDYHDFFGFKKELSKENEQGLIAELLFLNEKIDELGEKSVFNWNGSERNKRDFIFDSYGVEIKSTRNQEQDIVHISNENQLDKGSLETLYLKLYIFDENQNGKNIKYYIDSILAKIQSYECQKAFLAKVAMREIDPYSYEGRYKFELEDVHTYVVDDTFPKLTSKDIPSCIYDVKYHLNLSGVSYIEKEK